MTPRVQKEPKKRKKRQKCTQLQAVRTELGFPPRAMREVLGVKSRRTYEDYEAGRRATPPDLLARAKDVLQRNMAFMAELPARVSARVDQEYPGGVPSDI